ncbi:MAG: glycosyltransferase family A protein [Paludibacteraceae bacterium]
MVNTPYIIMPVKDAIDMAEISIRAIVQSGYSVVVYNDYSSISTYQRLNKLAEELGIEVIHIAQHTNHPSPNYRWVLQHARQRALTRKQHLIIIESDVVVRPDTIQQLVAQAHQKVGMVAAVTTDEAGNINFPYEYATHWHKEIIVETSKRLSFCCTLLTNELLQALDFAQLDPAKNWYDVTISHWSVKLGFRNLLMLNNPVLHKPHSSRPWKQLKYTNPLLYYWRKLIQKKDRI